MYERGNSAMGQMMWYRADITPNANLRWSSRASGLLHWRSLLTIRLPLPFSSPHRVTDKVSLPLHSPPDLARYRALRRNPSCHLLCHPPILQSRLDIILHPQIMPHRPFFRIPSIALPHSSEKPFYPLELPASLDLR